MARQEVGMRVAIIGARWSDIELEAEILGVSAAEITTDPGGSSEAIVAAAGRADVILAGPRPQFDAVTLGQLKCRGIVRYGVGYDNVDVSAAARNSIAVAYVPDYGTEAVALHAVTLAMAALRRIPQLDSMVKRGVWDISRVRPLHLPGSLTVGVVGFGRIGRSAAGYFANLGFGTVLACDEYVAIEEPGIEATSMEGLLERSDVVSLHAPGSGEGSLIGPNEIRSMRDGSVIVNTARGSLIDTAALVAGLAAGRPAVAALDVFDPEPVDLAAFAEVLDQVIMTPHIAWYTEESEQALRTKTAQEARRFLDGDAPLHAVPIPEEIE